MDIIEIDAASNRGIDDIKELRETVRFSPSQLKYKVFILDEAHQLSKDASNALLKTLEEPPKHAIFILATTEAHKMEPTIVSRCQRFDFRKLTVLEIISRLKIIVKNEKARIDDSALELIAMNSSGAIRDAEGLLDQVLTFSGSAVSREITAEEIKGLLGLIETKTLSNILDFIIKKDAAGGFKFLAGLTEKGIDMEQLTKGLVEYLRQGLVIKMTSVEKYDQTLIDALTKEDFEKLAGQIKEISLNDLRLLIEKTVEAENKTRYATIPQLPLELLIAEYCADDKVQALENTGQTR
jgi:DNA polymerase-3 subunit gamma/tau